jgi:hypothetical protein
MANGKLKANMSESIALFGSSSTNQSKKVSRLITFAALRSAATLAI